MNLFFYFCKKNNMLKILNKFVVLQWILTLTLLIISTFFIFKSSIPLPSTGFPILYQGIFDFMSHSIIGYQILVLVILISTLILIQIYFSKNKFTSKQSLLPSIFYLTLLLVSGSIHHIGPIFFTNFFIIIILTLTEAYFKTNSKSQLFFSGIIIGFSILIDPASSILLLFIIVSMIINTVISHKDLLIVLYGILTVCIYLISFYYFTDHIEWLWSNFQQIRMFSLFNTPIILKPIEYVMIPISIVIFIYIVFKINSVYETKVIVMRKKIITFNTLIFCLLGTFLLSYCSTHDFIGYLYVPICMLLSIFSQFKNRFFIHDILIILFIVGLWV